MSCLSLPSICRRYNWIHFTSTWNVDHLATIYSQCQQVCKLHQIDATAHCDKVYFNEGRCRWWRRSIHTFIEMTFCGVVVDFKIKSHQNHIFLFYFQVSSRPSILEWKQTRKSRDENIEIEFNRDALERWSEIYHLPVVMKLCFSPMTSSSSGTCCWIVSSPRAHARPSTLHAHARKWVKWNNNHLRFYEIWKWNKSVSNFGHTKLVPLKKMDEKNNVKITIEDFYRHCYDNFWFTLCSRPQKNRQKKCVRSLPYIGIPKAGAKKLDAEREGEKSRELTRRKGEDYERDTLTHMRTVVFSVVKKGVKNLFEPFDLHSAASDAACIFNLNFFFRLHFFRLSAFLLGAFDGKGVLFGTQQNIKNVFFCSRIGLHGICNEARHHRRHLSVPIRPFVNILHVTMSASIHGECCACQWCSAVPAWLHGRAPKHSNWKSQFWT